MLKFMRKYTKSYLIKIIFAVIIIVFIFYFGAGSINDRDTTIAEVGDFDISYPEYWETYNRVLQSFGPVRDKMDEKFIADLKENVLYDMIDKYILLTEAKKLGVAVSDMEFAELVGNNEAFMKDGKFDKDRYVAVLKQNRLDPEQYEKSQRTMLLMGKVSNIIMDTGTAVTGEDIWAGYVREKGKVDLAYDRFSPSSYRDKVTVSDKELSDLYEKEKHRFRGEDTYRLKYIVIDDKSSLKDDAVYMDLLKSKDIAAYARLKGLAVSDTGSVSRSELLKTYKGLKVETWIKDLRKGDISLPVRDTDKSYIFQLVDSQEGKQMEKSAALASIRNRLVGQKAKEMARLAAEDAIKSGTVGSKARTGLVLRTASSIPKLGAIPQGDTGLLQLTKEKPVYKKPVEIDGDYYVFSFAGEQQPGKEQWEKDREGFTRYYSVKSRQEFLKAYVLDARRAMSGKGKIKILKNPKEL